MRFLTLASLLLGLTAAGAPAAPSNPPPGENAGPTLRRGKFELTDEDRAWWAFQPVKRPVAPAVRSARQATHPIDAFVLARLEEKGLAMNPPATRRELIRRAYFDLIGLPPSPEAVAAFERDRSPGAWERLIDELLARSQYGERWARHWLDVVRYAESNGYERDGPKPHAWRYRDYVIRSFNEDKPYDRFILEQLAGDQLPGFDTNAIVATGFYRLHVWDDEPDSTLAAEFDDLDDILVTTSAAFLGLTAGCARCHDHKYDPVSQADYYRMLAFVRSVHPYGQHHKGGGSRGTGQITRPIAPPDAVAAWESAHRQRVAEAKARIPAAPDAEAKKRFEDEARRIEAEATPYEMALAVREDSAKPTHIFHRGDAQSPGAEVPPAFLSILAGETPVAEPPASSRRLALARWIAQPEHPLTARVMANRIWQHHFGEGLVRTPNDFGRTGERPTNPALLDSLAAELVDGGWRLKPLHKHIMMSRAYQMSSRAENPAALRSDEGNDLLWRQNLRRAEAEVIRDTVLAVSGALDLKAGGPSFFPALPKEVHATQDTAGKGWTDSPPAEQNRRSIYIFVKRALLPPLLEALDYTTTTVPVGARAVTTVAPQALMLLNDGFMQAQASALAERLRREAGSGLAAQVDRAFMVALQRKPTLKERRAALDMLRAQRRLAEQEQAHDPADAALRGFCLAMLNLNELIYID